MRCAARSLIAVRRSIVTQVTDTVDAFLVAAYMVL
jgi:hypothetical protein